MSDCEIDPLLEGLVEKTQNKPKKQQHEQSWPKKEQGHRKF